MADRFTDARVPDPGVQALFTKQHRWQCWLNVEAALAVAEAECGVIPAAAAQAIESAARLAGLDVEASEPAPLGTVGSSTMPHKRNPQLSDDCITIGAQLRALVPLALEGMLHDHEVDGGIRRCSRTPCSGPAC